MILAVLFAYTSGNLFVLTPRYTRALHMALHDQPLPPTPLLPAFSSRPSKRVPVPFILSSFPAPPSHIPTCHGNPPPTGPPSDPLPPLPSGPSRISEHEQLFILSSVRSQRSSNYSQKERDSIVSSRSISSLGRSVSRSNSLTITTSHTRIPIALSDISDSDSEAAKTTTSPVLPHNSPRRLRPSYQPNDSISSIDMRDILSVDTDDIHNSHQRLPTARHMSQNSIARFSSTVTAVPDPQTIQSSLSDLGGIVVTNTTATSPSIASEGQSQERGQGSDHMTLDELSSNKRNYQDSNASTTQPPQSPRVPSPDIATILSVTPRPALSLSRSRSGADADAKARSRSKSRAPLGKRRVVSTNANTKYPEYHPPNLNRRQSEGTLTTNKTAHDKTPSSELAYLHKHTDSNAVSSTNGKKSLSRSTSSATTRSIVSGYYDQEVEDSGYHDEALERVLEGEDSENEGVSLGIVWDSAVKDNLRGRRSRGNAMQEEGNGEEERGSDSDSSLDLHTPLPYVYLRFSPSFFF